MNPSAGDEDVTPPDCFDDFQTNTFLDDDYNPCNVDNMDDFFLSQDALNEFLAPSQETWRDFLPTNNEAIITIDDSRSKQWELAKKEIEHIRRRLLELIPVVGNNNSSNNAIKMKDIALFYLGPDSKAGQFLREQLGLSKESYLSFLIMVCVQGSYQRSTYQLYHEYSLLKHELPMSQGDYMKIWKTMAGRSKLLDPKSAQIEEKHQFGRL